MYHSLQHMDGQFKAKYGILPFLAKIVFCVHRKIMLKKYMSHLKKSVFNLFVDIH